MNNNTTLHPFLQGSKIVAYVRDSGGEDQELSVTQQEDFARSWCAQNGLILTKIFADSATPGSSTVGRIQFAAMIEHFHNPDCQDAGLIVWNLSRFSRSLDDSQYYRADLRRRGYIIHSLQDNIPNNSNGRVVEFLHDWKNSTILDENSSAIKRGLYFLVNNYKAIPGNPPKGFKREVKIIGKHRNGSPHTISNWVPDPELWDICKEAWRMRAQGSTVAAINRKLHLFGSVNSFTTFFTNRLYLGEMHYGDVVIKDYAEAMVTQEVWDIVQKRTQRRTRSQNTMTGENNRLHPRRIGSSFLLSGLCYCTRCGSIMNGDVIAYKNGTRLEYYHCRNSHNNLGCDARRISKPILEDHVINYLREFVLDPDVIKERDKEMALARASNPQRIKKELEGSSARLTNNTRRINNITNRLADEDNPPQSLLAKLHELEAEHLVLADEHERLKSMLNRETVFVRNPDLIQKMIAGFNLSMTKGTLEEKRDAIRSLVVKVSAERQGKNVRGIIQFINPTDEIDTDDEPDNNMPMSRTSPVALIHRHKIFTTTFDVSLEQKSR